MTTRSQSQHLHWAALFVIIIVAAFLRFYAQDWDQGKYLHPDERFIAQVSDTRIHMPESGDLNLLLDPHDSPINPRRDDADGNPMSFAYGTLPVYVQNITSWALELFSGTDWGSYAELHAVGRALTALADIGTLLMVYLIARRLFGSGSGLIASALYAFLVLPIQLSHFFTVDPWLTFFVSLTMLLLIRLLDKPTALGSLAVGAAVGCAFATKASVPSLLVPVLGVYVYLFLRHSDRWRVLPLAAGGAASSLVAFSIFEPYALVNSHAFIEDIRLQSRIVQGEMDIPYTRQFVGLTPGIYELRNMFWYTTGPAFLLASIAGLVWSIRSAIRTPDPRLLVVLLWIASYVPILLFTEARFLRYTLPLMPALAVLAGGFLYFLIASRRIRRVGQVATAITLVTGALWAGAFLSIYAETNTRIAASEWIYDNVEPGSTLSAESWDDPLPLSIDGQTSGTYETEWFDIYGDLPPDEKVDQLYDSLQEVDYVVISSDRVRLSVDNLPWRYAVQSQYYRRLLDGQLGFQLVYEASNRPEIFGISLESSEADESFSVYDHPHVRIFEKVDDLTREEFRERFAYSRAQPWEPQRYPEEQWLMLDEPVDRIETTEDATFNSTATNNDGVAIFSWLVALELIGLAILPAAAHIFRSSPDRGALTAKLLGLLILGWLLWIGASLNLWTATSGSAFAIMTTLALISWGAWYLRFRDGIVLPGVRVYALSLAVFLGVFAVFLVMRLVYPDFWQTYLGGEKAFELAYLRAIATSTEYPPYDPWYSGGIINYYYYGWHLVATVAKLAGIGVSNAFQLAVPTFAAMFASTVAAAAIALWSGSRLLSPGRLLAPLLALILVVFAGNLDPVRQVLDLGGQLGERFDFWGSTRVIDYTINEFPYFSFMWADLHPHLMNLPVLGLLVLLLITPALDLSFKEGTNTWTPSRIVLTAGALTGTLGTALVTNAWDMPTAIGLTIVALVYAGLLRSPRLALLMLGAAIGIAAAAYAMFFPFHSRFYSVVEGVALADAGSDLWQFLLMWGIQLGLLGLVIAVFVVQAGRSGIRTNDLWLAILAFVPAALIGAIIIAISGEFAPVSSVLVVFLLVALIMIAAFSALHVSRMKGALLVPPIFAAVVAGLLLAHRPAAALMIGVLAAALSFGMANWHRPSIAIPWGLIAVGFAIIAGVEVLYVVDDLQGGSWQRMNTVFKFYLQAWLLLGLGLAVIVAQMLNRLGKSSTDHRGRQNSSGWERPHGHRWLTGGIGVLAIGLLALSLWYPVIATPVRLDQDMPSSPQSLTLDGYAWMQGGSITNGTGDRIHFTGDLRAIEWLNREVDGTPVILEAAIGPYRGNGSRISSATGLPTPIGWDRHQRQQRYAEGINQRMTDVERIYNTVDLEEKLEILRSYDVEYIVVGDVERYWNTPEDTDY
ncbi:MAG: DUF2298 domain-containing protein, partial [Chloroflexota bacterium]